MLFVIPEFGISCQAFVQLESFAREQIFCKPISPTHFGPPYPADEVDILEWASTHMALSDIHRLRINAQGTDLIPDDQNGRLFRLIPDEGRLLLTGVRTRYCREFLLPEGYPLVIDSYPENRKNWRRAAYEPFRFGMGTRGNIVPSRPQDDGLDSIFTYGGPNLREQVERGDFSSFLQQFKTLADIRMFALSLLDHGLERTVPGTDAQEVLVTVKGFTECEGYHKAVEYLSAAIDTNEFRQAMPEMTYALIQGALAALKILNKQQ
jgi:hypothetical protein